MAYSGIVTKVRAMQAKLLTKEDFDNIAAMKSVLDIISFLKGKPAYSELLNQMDESLYHRGNIEKILYQSLYNDYTRLFRFGGIEQKKFLKLYLKRYEVDVINYCLRIVFNHYDKPFDLNYKKEFFDRYSQTTLWKSKRRILKKKELELFTRDCGSRIDLLNLQWIYRAKKYYHMLPPDIYTLTIPIHYRIHVDEFKALVEAPSADEFRKLMESTAYARKYDFEQKKTIEQMYKECLYRLYIADRRNNPWSIASITTYLFLKEEEIYKLTTALECVRYGLTRQETLGYLGGVTN